MFDWFVDWLQFVLIAMLSVAVIKKDIELEKLTKSVDNTHKYLQNINIGPNE